MSSPIIETTEYYNIIDRMYFCFSCQEQMFRYYCKFCKEFMGCYFCQFDYNEPCECGSKG